jgi:hypothetical protein
MGMSCVCVWKGRWGAHTHTQAQGHGKSTPSLVQSQDPNHPHPANKHQHPPGAMVEQRASPLRHPNRTYEFCAPTLGNPRFCALQNDRHGIWGTEGIGFGQRFGTNLHVQGGAQLMRWETKRALGGVVPLARGANGRRGTGGEGPQAASARQGLFLLLQWSTSSTHRQLHGRKQSQCTPQGRGSVVAAACVPWRQPSPCCLPVGLGGRAGPTTLASGNKGQQQQASGDSVGHNTLNEFPGAQQLT